MRMRVESVETRVKPVEVQISISIVYYVSNSNTRKVRACYKIIFAGCRVLVYYTDINLLLIVK